jgi:ligand-binding sensor domain-containing protein
MQVNLSMLLSRRHLLVLCGLLLVSGIPATCRAVDYPPISGFQHTAWSAREGAPAIAACFSQTPDGYLWVASPIGLYRFDGVQFEKVQTAHGERLLDNDISTLFVAKDGGLWIGYAHGGASLLKGDHLTNFIEAEGLAANIKVFHFAQDKDGRMWAATRGGLFRLQQERWRKVGSDSGYTDSLAQEVAIDESGTLWVLTSQNVVYLRRGASQFKIAVPQVAGFGFVYRYGGTIWMTRSKGSKTMGYQAPAYIPFLNGAVVGREDPGFFVDQSGALWAENTGDGLYRVSDASRLTTNDASPIKSGIEAFTSRDGLSGNEIFSVFEDRERNVWIGTQNGIDRFTPSKFVSIKLPTGATQLALASGDRGSVVVATFRGSAIAINARGETGSTISIGGTVSSMYRDPYGALWLGTPHGLSRVIAGRSRQIVLPDFHRRRGIDNVLAMTMDRGGSLWVSIEGEGVFRRTNGVWNQLQTPFISSKTAALCAFTDSGGDVWLGYPDDLIVKFSPKGMRAFTRSSGLQLGNVKNLAEGGGSLWAGGDTGIAFFSNQDFRQVQLADHKELKGVFGMLFARTGDLFITDRSGVGRIASSELAGLRGNSERQVTYQSLYLDSAPPGLTPRSSSVEASDGRLWFVSSNGLSWLNPLQEWSNQPPPPVLIKTVNVGNRSFGATQNLDLPPRSKSVQISYTAPTLTSSETVHFKYRLDGNDSEWQDAGTRREAFYTNLAPGRYVFHVIARNRDGIWNDTGASLAFHISPAFNQTRGFYLVCAATVCGLIYLLYLLKIRQVISVHETMASDRMAERERIARELHDTLLQGVHGLILRFSVLTTNYPEGNSTRAALEDTLVLAEKMLIEGRQRVRDLRSESNSIDLPEALSEAGHEMAKNVNLPFVFQVHGTPRPLRRIVSEETFNIGREAINNSFLHSQGSKVEAELIYSKTSLTLRVRDDGRGLDPSVLKSGRTVDHWGLPGMRERAASLGADFQIYSKAGFGTEVELRIAGRISFQKGQPLNYGTRIWRSVLRAIVRSGSAKRMLE